MSAKNNDLINVFGYSPTISSRYFSCGQNCSCANGFHDWVWSGETSDSTDCIWMDFYVCKTCGQEYEEYHF